MNVGHVRGFYCEGAARMLRGYCESLDARVRGGSDSVTAAAASLRSWQTSETSPSAAGRRRRDHGGQVSLRAHDLFVVVFFPPAARERNAVSAKKSCEPRERRSGAAGGGGGACGAPCTRTRLTLFHGKGCGFCPAWMRMKTTTLIVVVVVVVHLSVWHPRSLHHPPPPFLTWWRQ